MKHLNVEIKAKCDYPGEIKYLLMSENADFKGLDHQIDTYFKVKNGRLKLREGNIENYLIYYNREDKAGPKESRVTLYKTKPGSGLKQILTDALGELIVVDKERQIYFIDNIKFHIDKVKDLGGFVEIEAIDETGKVGREQLLRQCNHYLRLFKIKESDLINCSYSDLLLSKSD
tara:strand:- start:35 stop:556 length:522 start_codon:yes stop_codon:yes gene_type:complete